MRHRGAAYPASHLSDEFRAGSRSVLLFFPLLFLTPNFVPFDRLWPVMETLARINPISYGSSVCSLIIDGWRAEEIRVCVGVTVGLGLVLTALSLRVIARYNG